MPNVFELARTGLLTLIDQRIVDNDEQLITPASLRTVLQSLVHSSFVKLTDLLAGPNRRPDLWKSCRWYSVDTAGYDGDGPVLLDLLAENPLLFCLRTTVHVEAGPDGRDQQYALVYDAAGPYTVFRDATFTGPTIRAQLVRLGSVAQQTAGIPEFNPYGPAGGEYAGPNENGHNGAQVTYQDKIWTTKQPVSRDVFGGGLIPYPGTPAAAAYFKELSPTPVVHQQNTDAGTDRSQFTLGLNGQTQGTTEYRLVGFVCDSQRRNVALGARWTYQEEDGSDVVELVQCLDYAAPAGNPANTWVPVGSGGGGLDGFYREDDTVLNIDADGQTYALDLAEIVPTVLPNTAVHWVEGAGQAGGVSDRWGKPHPTFGAAVAAASPGHSLVVLPGGAATYGGRPAYDQVSTLNQNLTIQGLGRPQLYFGNVGVSGATAITALRFIGIDFFKPTYLIPNATVAMVVEYEDCTFGPDFYLRLARTTTPADQVQVIRFRRCRFTHTRADFGLVVFEGSTVHTQVIHVEFEDCRIRVASKPLAEGLLRTDIGPSTVTLRGTTALELVAGQAVGAVVDPLSTPVAEAVWLVDERQAGGGPAPDLANYYTKAESDARYTNGTELAGQFLGTEEQTATFTIYGDAAGTYQHHATTGVSGVSYQKNGAPATLPVALVAGDELGIEATGTGTVRLRTV